MFSRYGGMQLVSSLLVVFKAGGVQACGQSELSTQRDTVTKPKETNQKKKKKRMNVCTIALL